MKKAFTLAEVLITLTIVGVIAALTIPTLMNKYQRHVLNAQFRKADSQLHNIFKQWQSDEGEDLYSLYKGKSKETLENAFYKYLKGERETRYLNSYKYKTSSKNSITTAHMCPINCCSSAEYRSFKSVDGIMYNICGGITIAVDLNGYDKGPNKWGIDLFDFHFGADNKFYYPYQYGKYYCSAYAHISAASSKGNVNDGITCTFYAQTHTNYFNEIDY